MTRSRMALVLSLGTLQAGLTGCGDVGRIEAGRPDLDVDEITVRSDIGVIEVVTGARVRVVQELRGPEGTIDRTEHFDGSHLQIDTRCKSHFFCSVDTRIKVPNDVPVHLELGDGEIWATGVGDLDIELGTGLLDLDISGPLRASVGKGRIRAEASADQLVRLAVGQGDIEVIVPRTAWQVDVQASDTQLLGLRSTRNARGRLELTAPAGRVRVRATGAPQDSGSPLTP